MWGEQFPTSKQQFNSIIECKQEYCQYISCNHETERKLEDLQLEELNVHRILQPHSSSFSWGRFQQVDHKAMTRLYIPRSFSSGLCRGVRMFGSGRFASPCIWSMWQSRVYRGREPEAQWHRVASRGTQFFISSFFFFSREWQRGTSGLHAGKYHVWSLPLLESDRAPDRYLIPCRLSRRRMPCVTDAAAREIFRLTCGGWSQGNFTPQRKQRVDSFSAA